MICNVALIATIPGSDMNPLAIFNPAWTKTTVSLFLIVGSILDFAAGRALERLVCCN